ncbi:MAG: acetyltransferase, family [Rhodospirillales bacterium]|jgi:GNAT superfamily N-acetyltransferase|nr:acetyltransferase, family [Rhodospirillales bacterium]
MRVFRKILPFETWRLSEHLLRLSPEDRRLRFLAEVGEAAIAEHCRGIDFMRTVVIGFFEAGVLRGAAELHFDRAASGAELAITLEGDWQDRHIGTELLGHAITIAENRGVRTMAMLCLLDNRRMQHIVRKLDGRLEIVDDQAEARLKVPRPTQQSLWEEAAMEGLGLISGWLEVFGSAAPIDAAPARAA